MHKEAEKFLVQVQFMIDNLNLKAKGLIDSVQDVINFGDEELIYEFAVIVENYSQTHEMGDGVKDKMIQELAEGLSHLHSAKFLYQFAKKFPNIPTEKFAKAFLRIDNEEYVEMFAEYLGLTVDEFKDKYSGDDGKRFEPESA